MRRSPRCTRSSPPLADAGTRLTGEIHARNHLLPLRIPLWRETGTSRKASALPVLQGSFHCSRTFQQWSGAHSICGLFRSEIARRHRSFVQQAEAEKAKVQGGQSEI